MRVAVSLHPGERVELVVLARDVVPDEEAYRSEVLGEFRAGLTTLLDAEALQAAVVPGRRELQPSGDVSYRAFVDPSGGRADDFALAIGHREGTASSSTSCGRGVRCSTRPGSWRRRLRS